MNNDGNHTEPSPSRRDRLKAERRQAIYEAALELFTEKGYDAVRVEEITETVDVSKGTFFNYFPTKEQVLVEYRHAIYDEMRTFSEGLDGDCGHALFRSHFRYLARLLKREGDRYSMLHFATDRHREVRDQDQGRFKRVLQTYARFTRVAVAAGELSAATDVMLFAELVRDLWIGNLHAWIHYGRTYSLEARILKKIEFLFRPVA